MENESVTVEGVRPEQYKPIAEALKTLETFVKAGWDVDVSHAQSSGMRPNGSPCRCDLSSSSRDNSHCTSFGATWTDAVAAVAQKVIDRDGKLPDPLPESDEAMLRQSVSDIKEGSTKPIS